MITIGTDCSGIEAPIEALKQLGIPFQHEWSCEIDKFARQSIMANSPPEVMYNDITQRDHSQLPDVDLYVCGFPCQSFSIMGRKLGTQDPRGNIMLHNIDVIEKKLPRVFILENVKHFMYIEKGAAFNYLMSTLEGINDEEGNAMYKFYADVYNTKDYGIPQQRQRVYIVGVKMDVMLGEFTKPEVIPMEPLDNFIMDTKVYDRTNYSPNITKKLEKINFEKGFVFPNSNFIDPSQHICPTLSTRCDMFYHSTYHRYLSTQECLLLQGFNKDFRQVVSKSQLYRQIGNSMSVNVLKAILAQIIKTTILQYSLG